MRQIVWTCDGCNAEAREPWPKGPGPSPPDGWALVEGRHLCPGCRDGPRSIEQLLSEAGLRGEVHGGEGET